MLAKQKIRNKNKEKKNKKKWIDRSCLDFFIPRILGPYAYCCVFILILIGILNY